MPDREEQRRADLSSLRIERAAAVRRPARQRRRWLMPLLLLLAVAGGAAAWVARNRPLPVAVAYATASAPGESGPLPVLSGSGYVVTGDRYVSVGVRVAGRIDRYFVEEGQSVQARTTRSSSWTTATTAPPSAGTEARIASARANQALADADLRARQRS